MCDQLSEKCMSAGGSRAEGPPIKRRDRQIKSEAASDDDDEEYGPLHYSPTFDKDGLGGQVAQELSISVSQFVRLCAVCGSPAAGFFFGAHVCMPCKAFFIRATAEGSGAFECPGDRKCRITTATRSSCKFCRLQKCLQVGMCRRERPTSVQLKAGQQKCTVCGDLANGLHFGSVTCEGCKKFFRRGLLEHERYECNSDQVCEINPKTRNICRYCRFKKCLDVGMSRGAIKMGRPSKVKTYININMRQKDSRNSSSSDDRSNADLDMSLASFSETPDSDEPLVSTMTGPLATSIADSLVAESSTAQCSPYGGAPAVDKPGSVDKDQVQTELVAHVIPCSTMRSRSLEEVSDLKSAAAGGYLDCTPASQASSSAHFSVKAALTGYSTTTTTTSTGMLASLNSPDPHNPLNPSHKYHFVPQTIPNGNVHIVATGPVAVPVQETRTQTSEPATVDCHALQVTSTSTSSAGKHASCDALSSCDILPAKVACVGGLVVPHQHQDKPAQQLQCHNAAIKHERSATHWLACDDEIVIGPESRQDFSSLDEDKHVQNVQTASNDQHYPDETIHQIVATYTKKRASNQTFGSGSILTNHKAIVPPYNYPSPVPVNAVRGQSGGQDTQCTFVSPLPKLEETFLQGAPRPSKVNASHNIIPLHNITQHEELPKQSIGETPSCDDLMIHVNAIYWLDPGLPDTDDLFTEEHQNIIDYVVKHYQTCVKAAADANHLMAQDASKLVVDPFGIQCALPEAKSLKRNLFRNVTATSRFCSSLTFALDSEQCIEECIELVRSNECCVRLLFAVMNWYDQENDCFSDYFYHFTPQPWRVDYKFYCDLKSYARQLSRLNVDSIEAALLVAQLSLADDSHTPKRQDLVKDKRMKVLRTFQAYTTAKFGSRNQRIKTLFKYIPRVRALSILHAILDSAILVGPQDSEADIMPVCKGAEVSIKTPKLPPKSPLYSDVPISNSATQAGLHSSEAVLPPTMGPRLLTDEHIRNEIYMSRLETRVGYDATDIYGSNL